MKNKIKKIKKIIFLILINLFVTSNLLSNEINFEANSIELIDKDNKIIAKKNVKIFNQNETIYANEMDYDKSKQIPETDLSNMMSIINAVDEKQLVFEGPTKYGDIDFFKCNWHSFFMIIKSILD